MKTILIIDDDIDDIDLLSDAINQVDKSIQCVSVMSGEQALELLNNLDHLVPDYIFLDLNIPPLGGKQCFSKIRSIPGLSATPVILYTTSKRKEIITEIPETGSIYFLTKPTKFAELKRYVTIILENNWEMLDNV